MSQVRNLDYLNKHRIIYRRDPISDEPSEIFEWGCYYENGTNQCYELFRSRAKITTFKSLKWHMLVLWYLNPQITQDNFEKLCVYIVDNSNGFVTFTICRILGIVSKNFTIVSNCSLVNCSTNSLISFSVKSTLL